MSRYALPLVALGSLAIPAQAAEIQLAAGGPVIELTVTEMVKADPDLANVGAGVTTLAPSAVEAMRQNAEDMNRVVDRIEALGIARADIQTTGISLNPEYVWDQDTSQQRFTGYRAGNRVNVVLHRIDSVGQVLDALVEAGATEVGGIGWSIADPSAAQEQARAAAFATARARAEGYARLAGMAGVRLLEVNETVAGGMPQMFDMAPKAVSARVELAPVLPGQVQTGVTITVKFEMAGAS